MTLLPLPELIATLMSVAVLGGGASAGENAGQGGWARYQSAHVRLLAPVGLEIGDLLRELERAYTDVRSYGVAMPPMVQARCYSSVDGFVRGSGGQRYHLALATGRTVHLQPPSVLMRHGEMARALRHELVHIALMDAARRGLPRWMNEGLAMVVAGEKHPERLRFRTLAQLEDTLSRSRNYDNVRSAYGTAERLVAALAGAYGKGKLLRLVRGVSRGVRFEGAFESLTGKRPDVWARSHL